MRLIPAPTRVPAPLLGRAYADAMQAISGGAWTRVVFGAVTDAVQGAMTANGFTVPAAGVYDISVGIVFYDTVAGDYINISVRKNYGEALKIAELTLGGTGSYGATAAGALALAAGDVLSVWAQASTERTIFGIPGTEVTTFTVANWRP